MSKRIIDLPSGSISDSSLGFIGDPGSGALTETSFHAMKDYFQSGSLSTGSFVTTSSFNSFSASYHNDSSSFYNSIVSLFATESKFVLTSSFNALSSSYSNDSGSFNARINALSGSQLTGSFVTTLAFSIYSASSNITSGSFDNRINNIFNSESIYLPTASFNIFSSSYVNSSASLLNTISNVYASESNYTPTGSFNSLSSSVFNNSSSVNIRSTNIFSSQSNYLPTSSINGKNNYLAVFTGSQGTTFSNIYQSGSAILINQVNGFGGAMLQVAGPLAINDTSYILLPAGSTLQRPTGSAASFPMIRGNSDSGSIEYYNGSTWITFGVSSGSVFPTSSVTSVGLSLPSIFNVSNSPVIGAAILSASLNTQSLGLVFASPSSSNGVPFFRALAISDIAALTASFIAGFETTSSFNAFSSSYVVDSGSFNGRINNVYASESNYTPSALFNSFTGSYVVSSASFLNIINNVYASESNYLPSSSYLVFSASYYNDSSSNVIRNGNIFASQSNYLPSSSIKGTTNFLPAFSGVSSLTSSVVYQSGSSIIIGATTGSNNATLQVFGTTVLSGGLYDSTNSTGSSGQVLSSLPGGLQWISTGSGGWLLSGNTVASGSFLGSINAQDLIFKRNNVQVGLFATNNNIVLGNSNSGVTGSNAFVAGGSNNFANNMASVLGGSNNNAGGNSSAVIAGQNNAVPGVGAVSLGGTNLSGGAAYSVTLGRFNDPFTGSNSSAWIGTDPVFIIGNGASSSSLSNAMVVFKNGNIAFPFYTASTNIFGQSNFNTLGTNNNGIVTSSLVAGQAGSIPLFTGISGLTSSVIIQSGSQINIDASGISFNGNTNSSLGFGSFAMNGGISTGIGSFANGDAGHALGTWSHAEGQITTAIGMSSHTEGGYTVASGTFSHAEGSASYAFGTASHAEGIGTYAYGNGQTSIGVYNTLNNTSSLLVVGNGTTSSRSDLALFNNTWIQFNSDLYLSGSLHLSQSIYDVSGSSGLPGQVLSSVSGGGILWTNVTGASGSSGFVTNGIFGAFTSSYITDSGSFNNRINSLSGSLQIFSGSYETTASFNTFSSSVSLRETNIFASQSNYTPIASFNVLSSSYSGDSGSFNTRINNISSSLINLTGSYVTTGSFNSYTSSTNLQILNVFASESNYLPTGSINGATNYITIYSGVKSFTTGSLYQSGSSLLIGGVTGSNNSLLQVLGNIYISKSIYDSTNSTGSTGQVLTATGSGVQWQTAASSVNVLNFIIGDSGSLTPLSGSTQFSSSGNPLINRTILQFWQESFLLAPVSRSVAWYSFTSSQGIINLNNAEFDQSTYYSILYK